MLSDPEMRSAMGDTAKQHIRSNHDLAQNYNVLSGHLDEIVRTYYHKTRTKG